MEYLMTYGWAILIISIVLAALFQLGVFNPMAFAAKAQPGSCQVYRPNSPCTPYLINLEGLCNGEIPQYVASFNGVSSIQANIAGMPSGSQPRTITAWYYATQTSSQVNVFSYGTPNCGPPRQLFELYIIAGSGGEQPVMNAWCTDEASGVGISGAWVFAAYEYNGTYQILYEGANSTLYGPATSQQSYGTTPASPFYIGAGPGRNPFIGYIANIQIYNTSLSANEIRALYQEGIGGAPINLQNLVAWYPLNGNANDYSGNGNNGQMSNVDFVSNWYSGYTPP
ncbi:MAG: LamG-like jellyroll fold domain-containing protein [Candidatus Micrarchaeia archaeon]